MNTMPGNTCKCCNKIYDEHKMLVCCICQFSYYHQCLDLSISEVRAVKSKKVLKFTCDKCANITDVVAELKSAISSLQEEIRMIRKPSEEKQDDTFKFEEVVREVQERERRKCNLMIFGAEEVRSVGNAGERSREEKIRIGEILNYLESDLDISECSLVRLGKYDPNGAKPRPIKIKLKSETEVYQVVRKAKNLRNNRDFSKIRLSVDRTPKQIALYRRVRSELEERKEGGEKNLVIKYESGIPVIRSEN